MVHKWPTKFFHGSAVVIVDLLEYFSNGGLYSTVSFLMSLFQERRSDDIRLCTVNPRKARVWQIQGSFQMLILKPSPDVL